MEPYILIAAMLPLILTGCGDSTKELAVFKDLLDTARSSGACLSETTYSKSLNGGCQLGSIVTTPMFTDEANQSDTIDACATLKLNGYFDWSTPSKEQLTDLLSQHFEQYVDLSGAHLDGIPFLWTNDNNEDKDHLSLAISLVTMESTRLSPNLKAPYLCVRIPR